MDIYSIEKICGTIPAGFTPKVISGSNYIFQNDLSFSPLNMYDFFGRAATVNSFSECFYYANLGFTLDETTIFDYLIPGLLCLVGVLTFLFYKSRFKTKLNISFSKLKLADFKKFTTLEAVNSKLLLVIFSLWFVIQNYFLFRYVSLKALKIPSFIDEYNVLSSSLLFFTKLDFNAGGYLGGNYTVQLTSGPISSLGGVIGWLATESFTFSRFSNFIWIILLQISLSYFVAKTFNLDRKFVLFTASLFLILIPWWQGALYSLGEIPSSILFVNAMFFFSKYRKMSVILFSISIFFGKILTLLPFIAFYIVIALYEKNLRRIIKDIGIFLIPLSFWLLLVYLKYENGSLVDYLVNQFYFITEHKASGINNSNLGFFENFKNTLDSSEFSEWSTYEKNRIILLPSIFVYLIFRNRKKIDHHFGLITIPIISSTLTIYFWFWLFNSTKWIRHTQHFTVLIIFSLVYILNSNLIKNKPDLIAIFTIFIYLIDNNKDTIFIYLVIGVLLITVVSSDIRVNIVKALLIIFITLDVIFPYVDSPITEKLFQTTQNCERTITAEECRSTYLGR